MNQFSKFGPIGEARKMYSLVDRYEEIIIEQCHNNTLREYIVDFLSERNKKYHCQLTVKYFRQALQRQMPEIIDWFDRIQVLR
jgi:hypothetical protein